MLERQFSTSTAQDKTGIQVSRIPAEQSDQQVWRRLCGTV